MVIFFYDRTISSTNTDLIQTSKFFPSLNKLVLDGSSNFISIHLDVFISSWRKSVNIVSSMTIFFLNLDHDSSFQPPITLEQKRFSFKCRTPYSFFVFLALFPPHRFDHLSYTLILFSPLVPVCTYSARTPLSPHLFVTLRLMLVFVLLLLLFYLFFLANRRRCLSSAMYTFAK